MENRGAETDGRAVEARSHRLSARARRGAGALNMHTGTHTHTHTHTRAHTHTHTRTHTHGKRGAERERETDQPRGATSGQMALRSSPRLVGTKVLAKQGHATGLRHRLSIWRPSSSSTTCRRTHGRRTAYVSCLVPSSKHCSETAHCFKLRQPLDDGVPSEQSMPATAARGALDDSRCLLAAEPERQPGDLAPGSHTPQEILHRGLRNWSLQPSNRGPACRLNLCPPRPATEAGVRGSLVSHDSNGPEHLPIPLFLSSTPLHESLV